MGELMGLKGRAKNHKSNLQVRIIAFNKDYAKTETMTGDELSLTEVKLSHVGSIMSDESNQDIKGSVTSCT